MAEKKSNVGYVIKEIIILLCTILFLFPIFYFVISAFKRLPDILNYPLVITPAMFTTDNFVQAYKRIKYFKAVGNTAYIVAMSIMITIFCSSLSGFVIARVRAKRFQFSYKFFVALMVAPFVAVIVPLIVIMKRLGLINNLWTCILIQASWNLPFATFLFTGFMKTLPMELEEAALIDGCSMFKTYSRVFLPLQAPVVATCCIVCGMGVWNDYVVCASFLNSAKTPTLMIQVGSFFGQYVKEYGQSFAAVTMCSAPILILFIFLQKYFIRGMAAGAVKG